MVLVKEWPVTKTTVFDRLDFSKEDVGATAAKWRFVRTADLRLNFVGRLVRELFPFLKGS